MVLHSLRCVCVPSSDALLMHVQDGAFLYQFLGTWNINKTSFGAVNDLIDKVCDLFLRWHQCALGCDTFHFQ